MPLKKPNEAAGAARFEMPPIGVTEDEGGNEQPKPAPTVDDRMTQLADLIAGSHKASETRIKALETAVERLASLRTPAPAGNGAGNTPAPAEIDLPDPITRPKDFAKALISQVAGAVEGKVKGAQTLEEEKRRADARWGHLWEKFGKKYPKLAEREVVLQAAAARLRRNYDLQGIDLESRAFGNEDGFFSDLQGIAVDAMGYDPDTAKPPGGDDEENVDEKPDRTGGLRGGSPVKAAGGKANADDGRNVPSFIDQMKAQSPRAQAEGGAKA